MSQDIKPVAGGTGKGAGKKNPPPTTFPPAGTPISPGVYADGMGGTYTA